MLENTALDLSHLLSLGGSRGRSPSGFLLGQSHLSPMRPKQCLSPSLARAAGVSARAQKKQGLAGVERGPVRQPIRARLGWRCGTGPPRQSQSRARPPRVAAPFSQPSEGRESTIQTLLISPLFFLPQSSASQRSTLFFFLLIAGDQT